MENPELLWEWASGSVDSVRQVPVACAQFSNQGWTIFGIYPKQSRLDPTANSYDVVLFRQRELTDEEKQARAAKLVVAS